MLITKQFNFRAISVAYQYIYDLKILSISSELPYISFNFQIFVVDITTKYQYIEWFIELLGAVVFELSNRVQNVSGSTQSNTNARLFGKAQVDVNLSLGQIIRNTVFEEADIEYQPVAFFNTRIGLRNAFQVRKLRILSS